MENESSQFAWIVFFLVLGASWVFNLGYLILLHRVRGARITQFHDTGRACLFKTTMGEFRLDRIHQKINVKVNKATPWKSASLDFVGNVNTHFETKSSGIFEFFFSDFNIFDFSGRYRDVTHTATISLKVHGDDDIAVFQLKQYEQREWPLGQFLHNINLSILKKLGFYRELDEVVEEYQEKLVSLINGANGSQSDVAPVDSPHK